MNREDTPTPNDDLDSPYQVRLLREADVQHLANMLQRIGDPSQKMATVHQQVGLSLEDTLDSVASSTESPLVRFRLTDGWYDKTTASFVTTYRTEDAVEEIVSIVRDSGRLWICRADKKPEICTTHLAKQLGPVAWAWSQTLEPCPTSNDATLEKSNNVTIGSMLRFIWSHTVNERWPVFVCVSVAIVLGFVPPLLYQQIIDTAIPASDQGFLWSIVALLMVWNGSQMAAVGAQNFALIRLQNRSIELLLSAIWAKVFRLPVSYFQSRLSGSVAHQCTVGSDLGNRLSTALIQGGISSVVAACSLMVAVWISTSLFAAILPIVLLESAIYGWMLVRTRRTALELERRRTGYVGETVDWMRGISKIRTTQSERTVRERMASSYASILENDYQLQQLEDNKKGVGLCFQMTGSILVFFCGYSMLGQPNFTMGTFAAFLASYRTFASGILGVATLLAEMIGARATLRLMQPILSARSESSHGKTDLGVLQGAIEWKHVSFRYPQSQYDCLRDVSLQCHPGEIVGVVGPSGSGKSTLLRLLLGFEKPQSGQILLDEMDIRNIDIHRVRRQMGCVLQTDKLFQGTIRDNLDIRRKLADEQLWRLLDWVDIRNEVEEMGLKLDTLLNVAGSNLSGGQRQRLLIARALATNPRIIILDEALSGLDISQQDKILKTLRTRRITTIMVTHRLDTLDLADRICSLSAAHP